MSERQPCGAHEIETGRIDIPLIKHGTLEDLRTLERFHYASGRPAPPVLVLRATDARGGVAGVLAVSMPCLNGAWRERAWPGTFGVHDPGASDSRELDPRERARVLNATVRTISRVIVAPSARGTGIGVALVRAYLRRPLTRCTEAIASMGRASPLFLRAGMREVEVERATRDWRLIDALERAQIAPTDLAVEAMATVLMRRAFVRREVDRWLAGARGTRAVRGAPRRTRAMVAARAVIARPCVYVHGEPCAREESP